MGWISENRLDSLQRAYVLYDSLARRYPESPYAKKIQPKLLAVREAEQQKAAEENQKTESQEQDSSGVVLKQPVRVDDNENVPKDEIDVAGENQAIKDIEPLESRNEPMLDRMRERESPGNRTNEPSDSLRSAIEGTIPEG